MHLLEVGSCFSLALLLLGVAWFSQGFLQFLLLWIASSLISGPFAPLSATGGSCRVGVGELLPAENEPETVEPEIPSVRNSKQRRKLPISHTEEPLPFTMPKDDSALKVNGKLADGDEEEDVDDSDGEEHDDNGDDAYDYDVHAHQKVDVCNGSSIATTSEAEWTSADIDLLKKLMVRYPKGMLKRWEVIAESFDGSHSVESIVKMSKSIGEKKKGSNDSYSEFLAKRKGSAHTIASPLSQNWDMTEKIALGSSVPDEEDTMEGDDGLAKAAFAVLREEEKKKKEWTETEDKALLNALKTFPKDAPMRWEKVAMAVPSRTKQQCFRRFAQLKEVFRSNKLEKG